MPGYLRGPTRKSQFNDRTLTLAAGPRLIFENFDLRPELTARGRANSAVTPTAGRRAQAFRATGWWRRHGG